MKIDPEHPLLIAYALGELDEVTRASVEEALEHSPESRRAVEEILQTTSLLTKELDQEPMAALSTEQHLRIATAAARPAIDTDVEPQPELPGEASEKTLENAVGNVVVFRWQRTAILAAAAAACLALVLAGQHFLVKPHQTFNEERPAANQLQPARDFQNQPSTQPSITIQSPGSDSLALGKPQIRVQPGSESKRAQSPAVKQADPQTLKRYGLLPLGENETRSDPQPQAFRTVPLESHRSSPYNHYGIPGREPARPRLKATKLSALDGVAEMNGRDNNSATYPRYSENSFLPVRQYPLSTFSIDVDTASYANVRRFLNQDQLPPRDAVRVEEMINYFTYQYPQPRNGEPFAADLEVNACPWNSEHRLVRIALKGREMAANKRPPINLVFLIDVSGSMQPRERLPLIKQALRLLVKRMAEADRVAIVVYANSSGLVLPSTSAAHKETILAAIDGLEAGGSTNGGDGIQKAYAAATENFIQGGVNRVILCTDGDFNVGITSQDALVGLIQDKARSGVFLSALGVGTNNYKDALMQNLADKGNGNYHYIDTIEEAHKVLLDQMNATLVTIAKDVKIQVEFNPGVVSAYRLIGYEKRLLRDEDFNDDRKDAGEIGAGHTVTALYEIVPAGAEVRPSVDGLKYQPTAKPELRAPLGNNELLTLKIRYKRPNENESKLLEFVVKDKRAIFGQASADFKFASAVASFGMLLQDSEYKGTASFDSILRLAQEGKGVDESGYRAEFINLVNRAKLIGGRTAARAPALPGSGNRYRSDRGASFE
jgi:Ca-activated chloride channel family protein